MVSIKTGLTLGLIAAFVLFSNQIGTALGKGVRGFGESVISGITNPLTAAIPTVVTATTPANDILTNLQKQAGQIQTDIEEAIQTSTNLGGSVNPESSAAGNLTGVGDTPTIPKSVGLSKGIAALGITPEFAEKYSFVKPQEGKLDVSRAISSIVNPLQYFGTETSVKLQTARAKSGYGGYGSAINQSTSLAQAIQASAAANPEYFS